MEADIIAARFKASESMHGLDLTEVIGDGDSSVLYTVQTTVPYGRDVKKWNVPTMLSSAIRED